MDYLKTCPLCGVSFSINDLLHDPCLAPLGMRMEKDEPRLNFFFFTHDIPECGTTFVVPLNVFRECLPGPPPKELLSLTTVCEGHCLNLDDNAVCGQNCAYAPYRQLLQRMLHERKKQIQSQPESFSD